MDGSYNHSQQAEEISMSVEPNNNISPTKWKHADLCRDYTENIAMPCQSLDQPEDKGCSQSSDFQIINIDPCYVTAISSFKYETFKLSTAHVTRTSCENGRLAQMKANTKLKRVRKPYQLPNRGSASPKIFHGRTASVGNSYEQTADCELRSKGLTRHQPSRVVSLFDDRPLGLQKSCNSSLLRSRSLEDLRSLAKTTTVMFHSMRCEQDKDLDDVSNVMAKLHVAEKQLSQP